uniref:SHSP20.9 n=1 Tax=Agasicles hygrophila TaxID=715812 RepID=A0A7G8KP60_9CUCU|nr:sHSP20.9 [Agasicles hygrophila]
MSLLPYLLDDAPFIRPSRLLDQHFGMMLDPEDMFQPTVNFPRLFLRSPTGYMRNWKSTASQRDTGSTVDFGKDQFVANLDVQQFKPEEITVKTTGDNTVTIEGKHEEREDEHGQIYRHFMRTYKLPKQYDMTKIESKLSTDGVLSIVAPRIDAEHIQYKDIPVIQTGAPAKKAVEKTGDGDKN